MGLAYIMPVDVGQNLYDIITLSAGSPPERPHPSPEPPYPSHPIAGGPWPSHPIFYPPGTRPPGQGGPMPPGGGGGGEQPPYPSTGPGFPTNPIQLPPWAGKPQPPLGGGGGETPGPGMQAMVVPMPVSDPPATPPQGMPAGSTQVLVWFGPGTKPALGWVGPYASQQPPGAQPPAGGEGGTGGAPTSIG